LQNKAIRIITRSSNRQTSSPVYQNLKFLKFKDIVKLQVGKLMHSIHVGTVSKNILITRTENVHNYKTRNAANANFNQPPVRIERGKKSLSYAGPKLWHENPSDINNYPSILLKQNLKQNY